MSMPFRYKCFSYLSYVSLFSCTDLLLSISENQEDAYKALSYLDHLPFFSPLRPLPSSILPPVTLLPHIYVHLPKYPLTLPQ